MERTGLALVHEGEYVMSRREVAEGGGGVSVGPIHVSVSATDLATAADAAAAKVHDAVLNSGVYAKSMRRGLTRRL